MKIKIKLKLRKDEDINGLKEEMKSLMASSKSAEEQMKKLMEELQRHINEAS